MNCRAADVEIVFVFTYGWVGGDRPSDVVQGVRERYEAGITAVKLNGTDEKNYVDSFKKIEPVVERIASVRDAIRYDIDIGVDFHGRVHKAMGKLLERELDLFKLYVYRGACAF